MEEDEDARREAAIASARTLLPDIRPNSAVTADQLSKFQELRRRRLQIKAKSKAKRHLKKGLYSSTNHSHPWCQMSHEFVTSFLRTLPKPNPKPSSSRFVKLCKIFKLSSAHAFIFGGF
ncbi:hypothetical protein DM860_015942 [Cuscuta australis]|uniref:Uncharacterized protein n=1 Tax=Cuscuta australis TaxID=267555 RepID=A0A328DYK4_9ASTE|nr:hypothetical protein DM860_015942 [Cuscuta australis]